MAFALNHCWHARTKSVRTVRALLQQIRARALRLKFDVVTDLREISDPKLLQPTVDDCVANRGLWAVRAAIAHVVLPWSVRVIRDSDGNEERVGHEVPVLPAYWLGFTARSAYGAELTDIYLATHPPTVEVLWEAADNIRYNKFENSGYGAHKVFQYHTWSKAGKPQPEMRIIPTKLSGWFGRDYCLSQGALTSLCGSFPNFLRAHLSLLTLLEFANGLSSQLIVSIDDETEFGRNSTPQSRSRVWNAGHYNLARLAQQNLQAGFSWEEALDKTARALQPYAEDLHHKAMFKRENFRELTFSSTSDPRMATLLEALQRWEVGHTTVDAFDENGAYVTRERSRECVST